MKKILLPFLAFFTVSLYTAQNDNNLPEDLPEDLEEKYNFFKDCGPLNPAMEYFNELCQKVLAHKPLPVNECTNLHTLTKLYCTKPPRSKNPNTEFFEQ